MNHYDIDILARTLYGEAKANDREDAEAIACVIMNRVDYRNWPNTPAEVCQQPYQFSCWNANDPNRARILKAGGEWFRACTAIARRAIYRELQDATQTSTHYHTPRVKPKWSRGKKPVYETAGHLFFNDIDTPPPATPREALNQIKPISKSRTIQAAKAGVAGTATIAACAEYIDQAAPAIPLAMQIMDYAPWLIIALLFGVIAYMAWRRIDDRRLGVH